MITHADSEWGRRFLGKWRGTNAVQHSLESRAEQPWQEVAQDRERWARLEGALTKRILRDAAVRVVPHTRHMVSKKPDVNTAPLEFRK